MVHAEQVERWNGDSGARWVTYQKQLDRAIEPFGTRALQALDPQVGTRVLDTGCGTGTTTLALADRVGHTGQVVGLDVSKPMLDRARERGAHLSYVDFVRADASTHRFSTPFEALFSRFGVMFFDDPAAAFANLRRALLPEAPFVFVCWQQMRDNAWVWEPMQMMLPLVKEAPAIPGPHEPGPFALADADYLRAQLLEGGFQQVEIEPLRASMILSTSGVEGAVDFTCLVGPGARLIREQSADVQDQIRASLTSLFTGVHESDVISLPGSAWLVSARA